MRVLVDTSAVIAVVTNEPHKYAIVKATRGAELLAPTSLHWEIGNAFSAMMKRRRLSLDSAIAAVNEFKKIPIRLIDVDLESSLNIASANGMYAYDAYVLAAATAWHAPLLTLDEPLSLVARKLGIPILELLP
jgi:predicted nucleic acid-binding protein